MSPLRAMRQLARRWQRPPERSPLPTPPSADAVRELLRGRSAKHQIVEIVRTHTGPRLDRQFRHYVEWLDAQHYTFGSCEDWPLRLDARRAYLRYDVHVRDILGTFALAHLHEELQIPGSFQLCWEHSLAEVEAADLFLKLTAFDRRFVQFGLHCSPESSWLIAEKCGGRSEGLEQFVAGGAARALIDEWLSAFEEKGEAAPVLVAARAGAEAWLDAAATSFRRHFGPAKTVSGHGTSLAAAYLEAVQAEPRLSPLGGYLHPVEFLTEERIARHGFVGELTRLDDDGLPGPRIMFENPIDEMAASYRQRLAAGGGFVALFHPASWAVDHFQPFLETVTASDW